MEDDDLYPWDADSFYDDEDDAAFIDELMDDGYDIFYDNDE